MIYCPDVQLKSICRVAVGSSSCLVQICFNGEHVSGISSIKGIIDGYLSLSTKLYSLFDMPRSGE